LGGLTLDEPRYVAFGLDLVNGCHQTYAATASGLGPETFAWVSGNMSKYNFPPPRDQVAFYQKNGFYFNGHMSWRLRPEVVESMYYAYRATGDTKYQEWVWSAFRAIETRARAGSGYAMVANVQQELSSGDNLIDDQESYFLAETLKYLYLMFAEDAPWQFKANHTNQYV
jgi:mannosyl-oligosaccharide alpha-1,2-mannosidase